MNFGQVPKTESQMAFMSKSTTDYHSLQCTFLPEMLPTLHDLFTKQTYSYFVTKYSNPVMMISVMHDNVSIEVKEKDSAFNDPVVFHSGHKKGIRRIDVWEGTKPHPQIVTVCNDSTMKILDYTGKCLRNMDMPTEMHKGRINCVKISENELYEDTLIVTGGVDMTVKYWGLKVGKLKKTLVGHRSEVVAVGFCPGTGIHELMVVSADSIGEIRLWDKIEGKGLRLLTFGTDIPKTIAPKKK